TTIVKSLVSFNGGVPLSVTLTVRLFVPGPCASVGVHENTPLAGSMVAPGGGPTRLKVSVLAGRSGSLAVAVTVMSVSSLLVRLLIGFSTGGEFTSLTTTVNVLASLSGGVPLSVTRTVSMLVEGPCASVGVQVNAPLAELIAAPAGAPGSRLKCSVFAGK